MGFKGEGVNSPDVLDGLSSNNSRSAISLPSLDSETLDTADLEVVSHGGEGNAGDNDKAELPAENRTKGDRNSNNGDNLDELADEPSRSLGHQRGILGEDGLEDGGLVALEVEPGSLLADHMGKQVVAETLGEALTRVQEGQVLDVNNDGYLIGRNSNSSNERRRRLRNEEKVKRKEEERK